MTTSQHRESAQIITFPGRPLRAGERRNKPRTTVQQPMPDVARVAYGSGWYHEEAVEEAIRAAKR
jgi:Protein of unknown function (DUF2735)